MVADKRVVVAHNRGRLKGLHQIIGYARSADDQLAFIEAAGLSTSVPNADLGDHHGTIDLVTVKPRFVLYREPVVPEGTRESFHPAQK